VLENFVLDEVHYAFRPWWPMMDGFIQSTCPARFHSQVTKRRPSGRQVYVLIGDFRAELVDQTIFNGNHDLSKLSLLSFGDFSHPCASSWRRCRVAMLLAACD
jgi:hypothetical protein